MSSDKVIELARKAYPNDENLRVAYMLGLNEGYGLCKEQMMKDALDGVINSKENDIILYQSLPAFIRKKCLHKDDEVKLIIIKES